MRRFAPSGCLLALVTAFIAAPPAIAQHSHGHEGSSYRQTGTVAFANSGAEAAQKDFLQGLAQLHNFQYPAAAAAFRRAQQADPDFALAYWGEAMTYTHPVWAEQDLAAARAALAKLGPTRQARLAKVPSEREKAYLAAAEVLYGDGDKFERDRRYAIAMEQLHATYPDDVDATCFYALALLGTSHAGRDDSIYMRAAALMVDAFEHHPNHPGAAHYLIHSVDDAAHAPLGLRAANAYGKIAPDSPHAQHMTSHIYLALGMWRETVAANEASVRVANRNVRAANPNAPVQRCSHAHIWLSYGRLQLAQFDAARRVVEECGNEVREHPGLLTGRDPLAAEGSSASAFEEMRTRYLIDSGDWSGSLARAPGQRADGPVLAAFSRDFADAYQAARYAKSDAAAAAVHRAEASARRLMDATAAAGVPEGHPQREVPAIEIDQLNGLLLLKQGEGSRGMELLTKAAAAERTLPADYGPPSLHKPANELLGEVLLDAGQAREARTAFETALRLAPGRVQSLEGLARCADALGDAELRNAVRAKLKLSGG